MITKNSEVGLNTLTAHQLIEKLNDKEITPEEILSALSKRIKETDSKIKAYIRTDKENLQAVKPIEQQTGLLKGIPISIKDNICTEAYNTECCSKSLEGFSPPYDATVIERLKDEGAVIFSPKTNMDEFAFGSSTENSCFGPTYNPWDLSRVAGGSSGGSAAAVSCDEAIIALGSDTGGSIRQPASFCGVVGLKPTYGRVSRFGLIASASSLDQIGPITKDVRDSAILMNIISGYDEKDSTSANIPTPDYTKALVNDIKGLKVGIPKEYFTEALSSEVEMIIKEAIEKLKNLGAICQEISLPHTQYAIPAYSIIAAGEASSNLAKFDGIKYGLRRSLQRDSSESKLVQMYKDNRAEGFSLQVKRQVILGTYFLLHDCYEVYYLRAQKIRTLIRQDFIQAFNVVDCIIGPTSPWPAFKIGERAKDPLKRYFSDIYTCSANLAGIPAISLPCGFTRNGLPVGLQILARSFAEEILFRVAYTYEQNTPWHKMKPKI